MKSKMLISLLVIALGAAIIGGTMAWFTGEDDAGEATFTAGTLTVDVSDGLTEFEDLLAENMNPGDVYDEMEIIIENKGTKNLAWFGNWTAEKEDDKLSDALLDGIYIDSAKMEFLDADGNPDNWEDTDQFVKDGRGYGDHPDWYNDLADDGEFDVLSLRQWIDNNGMGSAPYEHMGALKPGYSYKLTIGFGFTGEACDDYQGDMASPINLGFEVDATQIHEDALDDLQETFSNHYGWLNEQIDKQE